MTINFNFYMNTLYIFMFFALLHDFRENFEFTVKLFK